jgi:hypothetical protein
VFATAIDTLWNELTHRHELVDIFRADSDKQEYFTTELFTQMGLADAPRLLGSS